MDEAVKQAVEHARNNGWKVVFVGHSLEGFPAQMYAVQYGAEAYPFNSGELTDEQYKTALRKRSEYYGDDQYYAPEGRIIKVNTHTDPLNMVKGVKLEKQYYIDLGNDESGHPIEKAIGALDSNNKIYDEAGVRDLRLRRTEDRAKEVFDNRYLSPI